MLQLLYPLLYLARCIGIESLVTFNLGIGRRLTELAKVELIIVARIQEVLRSSGSLVDRIVVLLIGLGRWWIM